MATTTTEFKPSIRGVPTDLRSESERFTSIRDGEKWRSRLDPAIVPAQRLEAAKMASVHELGNTVRFGYGWMNEVDHDSDLRINPDGMTNPRSRVQLMERPFTTVPYMGRGDGDVEIETLLLPGTEERDMKSCLPKSTAGVDRLEYPRHWNPQIPGCVIFPGIRGGDSTRAAMRRPLQVPCPVFAQRPCNLSYS